MDVGSVPESRNNISVPESRIEILFCKDISRT